MNYDIKIISLERVGVYHYTPKSPGLVRRILVLSVNGITTNGNITYEGTYDKYKMNPHNIYRVVLENKSISKSKDWKEIRLAILKEAYTKDLTIARTVIERSRNLGP